MSISFYSGQATPIGSAPLTGTAAEPDGSIPPNSISNTTGTMLAAGPSKAVLKTYAKSIHIAGGAGAGSNFLDWTTNLTYGIPFIVDVTGYFPSLPSSGRIINIFDAVGTKCSLNLNGSGSVVMFDSAGTGSPGGNMATAIPAGQLVRIAFKLVVGSATVGQTEVRYYADPSSATVTDSKLATATMNTRSSTVPNEVRVGQISSLASQTWDITYVQFSNTGTYPGPPPLAAFRGPGFRL